MNIIVQTSVSYTSTQQIIFVTGSSTFWDDVTPAGCAKPVISKLVSAMTTLVKYFFNEKPTICGNVADYFVLPLDIQLSFLSLRPGLMRVLSTAKVVLFMGKRNRHLVALSCTPSWSQNKTKFFTSPVMDIGPNELKVWGVTTTTMHFANHATYLKPNWFLLVEVSTKQLELHSAVSIGRKFTKWIPSRLILGRSWQ